MTKTISATAARANFAEIIDRVLYSGDEYIIQKQGKPAALVTPIKVAKNKKYAKDNGIKFLLKLAKYRARGGPSDLARNHDKYTWE